MCEKPLVLPQEKNIVLSDVSTILNKICNEDQTLSQYFSVNAITFKNTLFGKAVIKTYHEHEKELHQ